VWLTDLIQNNISNEENNHQSSDNDNEDNSQNNILSSNEWFMSLMWKPDNIDYFNLKFNEQKPDTNLIESSSQHIYYWDVYIFVN